jgi:hypothetical protein
MPRTATTELLPVWRSDVQPLLLYAALYDLTPPTASGIAARFGFDRELVSREARRLTAAGIINSRAVGRSKVLTVALEHPAIGALRTLVDLTVGPLVDLRQLYTIDGVSRVFIFGSWARRHLGEPGPPPRDIDVLVVGDPDAYEISNACLELSGRYSVSVNPMVVSISEYDSRADNPLLHEITTAPIVEVPR